MDTTPSTYQLVTDEDCHWYIIPCSCISEWYKWLHSSDYYDGETPKFAVPLNSGVFNLRFDSYFIKE